MPAEPTPLRTTAFGALELTALLLGRFLLITPPTPVGGQPRVVIEPYCDNALRIRITSSPWVRYRLQGYPGASGMYHAIAWSAQCYSDLPALRRRTYLSKRALGWCRCPMVQALSTPLPGLCRGRAAEDHQSPRRLRALP